MHTATTILHKQTQHADTKEWAEQSYGGEVRYTCAGVEIGSRVQRVIRDGRCGIPWGLLSCRLSCRHAGRWLWRLNSAPKPRYCGIGRMISHLLYLCRGADAVVRGNENVER